MHWDALDSYVSRGRLVPKAARLAQLHEQRQATLAQHFTPAWVVSFLWASIEHAFVPGERYSLFDNSVGSASMFRHARPEQHSLNGLDVDADVIGHVTAHLDTSGFVVQFRTAGMESVELGKFSVGLINPPFSLTLTSKTLTPFDGVTCYGILGPNTSALSQDYALVQALACCDILAAVVPRALTAKLCSWADVVPRLRAVFHLPSDTFAAENVAVVSTDLLIFGSAADAGVGARIERTLTRDSVAEPLPGLHCRAERELASSVIRVLGRDFRAPAITRPAAGDKRVILKRAGRRIALQFFDGATEGRVKNALLKSQLHSTHLHGYAKETRYAGQFALSLDVLVMQPDSVAALADVARRIAAAGGEPVVLPSLLAGLRRLSREHQRMTVPYGRVAYSPTPDTFTATARRLALLNRVQRGAVVAAGDVVTAKRAPNGFSVSLPRGTFDVDVETFSSVFEQEAAAVGGGSWQPVYPPIRARFPAAIEALEIKAKRLGLDRWLGWDFQMEDLCELAFRPHGGVCGWQMALGKTRLALALGMLSSGRTLIVVKSRLIDEMERELRSLGVPAKNFKILRQYGDGACLSKLNIVSYELLKRPLDARFPRYTLARFLRKRVSTVIADEGGLVANDFTQQSRALQVLGAQRHYVFDGTPLCNYPRDMLGVAAWCVGAARSYQPYSLTKGYLEPRLLQSALNQPTGRAAFLEHFVVFEWATNEFLDSGRGAKREVPKINPARLAQFRTWLAPLIKRRVQQEPAVQRHVRFPVPHFHDPIAVDWDLEHLALYVQTVDEFATWYRTYVADQTEQRRGLNLTLILMRLEACFKAANTPSTVEGWARPFQGLTSKERACVDLVVSEVGKGRRPIVFARNPLVLRRLSAELRERGISNLIFTGEEPIKQRLVRLNSEIREGDAAVMLASLGVTQDGLNLPELDTFIFYNRSYKSREEFQAIYRLIRPQQKRDVYGYFLHLAGSIDEYMAQLIRWKTLATDAGLDFGEQVDDAEFSHFDVFIERLLASLPHLTEKLRLSQSRCG